MKDNCGKITGLISDYIDERLDPRRETLVTEHIRTCEGCRKAAAKTRLLVSKMSRLSAKEAPFDLWSGVAARLPERKSRRTFAERFTASFGWRMVAVPATIAIAATFIFAVKPTAPPQPSPSVSAEYGAYMRAYSSFRSQQALSDRATIDAASRLQRQGASIH